MPPPPSYAAINRRSVLMGLGGLGAASLFYYAFAPDGRGEGGEPALRVLEWGGYEDPELFVEYLSLGNRPPKFSFMSSDLETVNRLRAGIFADIANPTNNALPDYLEFDLITPWDTALIPRYDQIIPAFRDYGMRNGRQYFIPVTWGYESVIYNADRVDPNPNSFAILFDDRYKGRIAWWDNTITLVIAGMVLGAGDPFAMTDRELDEATRFLTEKKRNVRFLWNFNSDWEPEFVAGNLDVSYGFPASWLLTKRAGVNAVYMSPDEGRIVWTDGYVQLHETRTHALNHAFVNAWLAPDTGLRVMDRLGYAHTNTSIDFSRADSELVAELKLDQPDILGTDQVVFRRHVRNNREYARAWDRVKAG